MFLKELAPDVSQLFTFLAYLLDKKESWASRTTSCTNPCHRGFLLFLCSRISLGTQVRPQPGPPALMPASRVHPQSQVAHPPRRTSVRETSPLPPPLVVPVFALLPRRLSTRKGSVCVPLSHRPLAASGRQHLGKSPLTPPHHRPASPPAPENEHLSRPLQSFL